MLKPPINCIKESVEVTWTDEPPMIMLVHRRGDNDPSPNKIRFTVESAEQIVATITELVAFLKERAA